MLHVIMVEPHPQTPTYLLTCAHTAHRTIIDPVSLTSCNASLKDLKLDLILLTTITEAILATAAKLRETTGAPILAGENFRETNLPIARYLEDGAIVGLGPLAQTILIPHGQITCYALGTENVIFTGPLFATGVAEHKANRKAMATLAALPEDTGVCGGGAHNLPLKGLLEASHAS